MRGRDLLAIGGLAAVAGVVAFAVTSNRVENRDAAQFAEIVQESSDVLQYDLDLLRAGTESLADYLHEEASDIGFRRVADQAQTNLPGTAWAWVEYADWGTNVVTFTTSEFVTEDLMAEVLGDPAVGDLLAAVWSGETPDPPVPTLWTAQGAAIATAAAVHDGKAVLGVAVVDDLVRYPFFEVGDSLDFALAAPTGQRLTATSARQDPPQASGNVLLAEASFTLEAWRGDTYAPPLPGRLSAVTAVAVGLLVLFGGVAALGVRHRLRTRLSNTLEIQARTAELRAEAEARRRLVAFAAHDLRSPLAVVQGTVQYLRGEDADTERAALLDSAERQTRRVLQLVNDLIDAAATEAGELQLDLDDLDAATLCRTVVDDFGIPRSRVVGDARVRGDRARLERLLTNLLVNAAKYGPAGEDIVVTCRSRGEMAEIEVCDGGTQLAGADPETLFATFRRGDGESVRDVTGSGLGLAFAREIARAHGGDLVLACDAPTTFRLVLPSAGDSRIPATIASADARPG